MEWYRAEIDAVFKELQTSEKVVRMAEHFAEDGMRVLAMAYREVEGHIEELTNRDIEGGFTLAGLQGMIDPPRPEAVDAVRGQLLWINLVTNGLQDMALAFEPAEKDVLKRKPREGCRRRNYVEAHA